MMSHELRLFGDRFRSCLIITARVGVHRLVPNVTAEPERDSIPQGATPACWVVQDKTSPNFVYFLHNGRVRPHAKPNDHVYFLCIHASLSTKIVEGMCYTRA
jgi:hypothetical protein